MPTEASIPDPMPAVTRRTAGTSYTDPVTGADLPEPSYASDSADPFDTRGYAGDRKSCGPNEPRVDPVTGAARDTVPVSHATLSEINEMKMTANVKHSALIAAAAAISQQMSPADFAAAKSAIMARAADIRNHIQGFRADDPSLPDRVVDDRVDPAYTGDARRGRPVADPAFRY